MESRSFRRYGYYGAQGLSPKRILLYYDRGLSPRQGGNDRGLEKKKSRKETMNVSLFFLFINLILLRKIHLTTNKHGTILIQTYPYRNITDHQNYPRKRKTLACVEQRRRIVHTTDERRINRLSALQLGAVLWFS